MYPIKENINKVEEILEESIKNVEQRDKNREKMKDRLRGIKDEVRRSNIPLSRTYRKKTRAGAVLEQVAADRVYQITGSRIPVNPKQDE